MKCSWLKEHIYTAASDTPWKSSSCWQAGGVSTRSNVTLALAHQPVLGVCAALQDVALPEVFWFSAKLGLSPQILRRLEIFQQHWVFWAVAPSQLQVSKHLSCFSLSALHTLDEAPTSLHKASYSSPLPIKAFTRVRQLVCKACCLPCWLMLSDCSLVLPRWSICTHLLPFVL